MGEAAVVADLLRRGVRHADIRRAIDRLAELRRLAAERGRAWTRCRRRRTAAARAARGRHALRAAPRGWQETRGLPAESEAVRRAALAPAHARSGSAAAHADDDPLPEVRTDDPVIAQGDRLVAVADLPSVRRRRGRDRATTARSPSASIDGVPFAVSNVCRHQFAKLGQGQIREGCLECPWHRARYDVRTGEMVSGPKGRIFGFPPYSRTCRRRERRLQARALRRRAARRAVGSCDRPRLSAPATVGGRCCPAPGSGDRRSGTSRGRPAARPPSASTPGFGASPDPDGPVLAGRRRRWRCSTPRAPSGRSSSACPTARTSRSSSRCASRAGRAASCSCRARASDDDALAAQVAEVDAALERGDARRGQRRCEIDAVGRRARRPTCAAWMLEQNRALLVRQSQVEHEPHVRRAAARPSASTRCAAPVLVLLGEHDPPLDGHGRPARRARGRRARRRRCRAPATCSAARSPRRSSRRCAAVRQSCSDFSVRNSSMPYGPSSRPWPDCL